MTVARNQKLTSLQKRFQILQTQLYGKEKPAAVTPSSTTQPTFHLPNAANQPAIITAVFNKEGDCLKRDLLKILILSTLIFAMEFGLYFGLNNKLINLFQ